MELPQPAPEPVPVPENGPEDEETPATAIQETPPGAEETEKQPDNRQLRKPTFFQRLSQYDKTLWENQLMLYLYRLAPVTDRAASGSQVRNIAKLVEPIDEDYILKNEVWGGSGRYRVILTKKDPNTNKYSGIDSVDVELENQAFPPRVPPGEWVDDPRNKRWAWARKKEEAAPTVQAAQQGLSVDDAFKIIKQFQDWTSTSKDQSLTGSNIVELIKQTQTANDPQKIIAAAREMLEIMKPPAAPDPDAATERMVKLLALMKETFMPPPAPAAAAPPDPLEQMGKILGLLKGLMPTPPPAVDPVAQVKQTLELAAMLRDQFEEKAASSRMNGWQEMFQPLLDGLGKALPPLGTLLIHKLTAPPAGLVGRPAVPTAPAAPSVAPPSQPQNGEAGGKPDMPADQNRALIQKILEWITPPMLQHLQNDLPGSDFAGWVADGGIDFNGIPISGLVVIQKAREIGKETLVEIYRNTPQVWAQLAPMEAKFQAFVEQFLSWDPNAQSDDDEPETPIPAPKTARKGATK